MGERESDDDTTSAVSNVPMCCLNSCLLMGLWALAICTCHAVARHRITWYMFQFSIAAGQPIDTARCQYMTKKKKKKIADAQFCLCTIRAS